MRDEDEYGIKQYRSSTAAIFNTRHKTAQPWQCDIIIIFYTTPTFVNPIECLHVQSSREIATITTPSAITSSFKQLNNARAASVEHSFQTTWISSLRDLQDIWGNNACQPSAQTKYGWGAGCNYRSNPIEAVTRAGGFRICAVLQKHTTQNVRLLHWAVSQTGPRRKKKRNIGAINILLDLRTTSMLTNNRRWMAYVWK